MSLQGELTRLEAFKGHLFTIIIIIIIIVFFFNGRILFHFTTRLSWLKMFPSTNGTANFLSLLIYSCLSISMTSMLVLLKELCSLLKDDIMLWSNVYIDGMPATHVFSYFGCFCMLRSKSACRSRCSKQGDGNLITVLLRNLDR